MPKMTDEEVKRYYASAPRFETDFMRDIEAAEGEDLLDEIETRSHDALIKCAEILDAAYPCFEKTIEIKLRDTKDRIPEQAIGCDIAAYLGRKPEGECPPANKNITDYVKSMKKREPHGNRKR